MLTERQIALLEHLQANCGRFCTQYEIAMALPQCYPVDAFLTASEFHDSAVRLQITKDIRAINDSDDVQHVIISCREGIKLASREEFDSYIKNQYASVFRRLNRVRRKERKGKLDGQLVMVSGDETAVVSAFVPSYSQRRKDAGIKATELVEHLKLIDRRIDASLLSKIENGLCMPTKEMEAAMDEYIERRAKEA